MKIQMVADETPAGKEVAAEIPLEDKSFSSGSKGFYFGGHVTIDGKDYYAQVIISRKG